MNSAPYTLARAGLKAARRLILQAAHDAAASITVCAALKDAIVGLGATAEKITVLRNGVDLDLFRPEDRAQARAACGMHDEFALASVGHLIERKGHHLVIEALPQLPDAAGIAQAVTALRRSCRNAPTPAPTPSNSTGSRPPRGSWRCFAVF